MTDPIGRFQRTFNITLTMVFGTTDERSPPPAGCIGAMPASMASLTEPVGVFPAGSRYGPMMLRHCAGSYATLTETAPLAYELIGPPLSAEDRERYYAETRLFAALFGIPQDALPQSWADFVGYVDRQ